MAKKKKNIKVTFLGGVGEFGKNLYVVECGEDMIVVDMGVSFPKDDSPGMDAIIPDITYLKQNVKRLRGVVLTHGHEDHIGAIPYYADELKGVPIFGTSLTLGLLRRKLEYEGKKCTLVTVAAGDAVTLGDIKVEFIKVCHSMAGACSLALYTEGGTVFVTGDFKFDETPIDGKKTDIRRIAEIGKSGVTLMLGESTNIERKGYSTSEKVVGQNLENIFAANKKKRLIVACFASSNYRVQQVVTLAHKYGRKVILAGKSMKGMVEVASACGDLNLPKGVLADGIGKLKPGETLILATGSQGEPLSALNKLSKGEFNGISVGEDDIVVLSSSPIPGNEKAVYDVINALFKKGADVIYDSMNDIHVSGHAYEEELKEMLRLVHPKYFMPVHGEYRHQFKHAELARNVGIPSANIVIPDLGESYSFTEKSVKKHSNVQAGSVYVDGIILEDGATVVSDRRSLARYGVILVLAAVDLERGELVGEPDVVARGFGLTDETEERIKNTVKEAIRFSDFDRSDIDEYAKCAKRAVRKLFMRDRQFPIIIPVIVED